MLFRFPQASVAARNPAIARSSGGLEPVGNAQRILLEEVGPLESVSRLVEPVPPLLQPGGGGFAAKR